MKDAKRHELQPPLGLNQAQIQCESNPRILEPLLVANTYHEELPEVVFLPKCNIKPDQIYYVASKLCKAFTLMKIF